jgi:transposase-like protein
MPTKNMDLVTLMEDFGTEAACREALEELRWPEGVKCLRCGHDKISHITTRNLFECAKCEYQFSVRTGTIFSDSKLPLSKWFLAAYIMCESRKGVSANQLKRMLRVSYKTAWYLCHRIRHAMFDEDAKPLTGVVEIDETLLGGKRIGGGSGPHGKVTVIGAVSRDGQVRLAHVPDRKSQTIRDFVNKHVGEAEALYSDSHRPYRKAARKRKIPHGRVDHSRKQWVNGNIHTNTIESVWSLLDRSIIGAFHKVSTKHLPKYLHEVEWRHNNRENEYLFRDTLLELLGCGQFEYKELIANAAT